MWNNVELWYVVFVYSWMQLHNNKKIAWKVRNVKFMLQDNLLNVHFTSRITLGTWIETMPRKWSKHGNTKIENTGFVWPYPKLTLYQLVLITLPTTFGVVLARKTLGFDSFLLVGERAQCQVTFSLVLSWNWNFLTTPCCWKDLNNKCLIISLKTHTR